MRSLHGCRSSGTARDRTCCWRLVRKPRVRVDGKLQRARGRAGPHRRADRPDRPAHADSRSRRPSSRSTRTSTSPSRWLDRARLRGSAFTQKGEIALALRMIPSDIPTFDELGTAPRGRVAGPAPPGAGAPDRPDRFGKVHHPGLDHRPHQRDTCGPHPDHRGPHRVRAQARPLRRHPARGRDATAPPSSVPCAPPCARTPTSCWSVRCATSSRSSSPSPWRRPATWCSRPCTPTTPPRRSTASSTSSRPGGRSRSGSSSRSSLGAVIAQRLVPRIGGGMVAAFEILIANHPVRNIIREGKTHQLPNLITTGQAEGMCSLESSLADLVLAADHRLRGRARPSPRTPRSSAGWWGSAAPCSRLRDDRHLRPARSGSPLFTRRRGHSLRAGVARRAGQAAGDGLRTRGAAAPVTFTEVVDMRPSYSVIALNAPVGYLDIAAAGGRTCDREARALLGARRGSSIQSAPVRSSTRRARIPPRPPRRHQHDAPPRYREVAGGNGALPAAHRLRGALGHVLLRAQRRRADAVVEASREGHRGAAGAPRGEVSRGPTASSTPRSPAPRCRTSSTSPPSSGRRAGSSTGPPSASPRIPNGTSRGCGWRSCAELHAPASRVSGR